MARSGWVAVAITALLVVGLGNDAMVERAREAGDGTRDLLASLTGFPLWSTDALGDESSVIAALSLKVILFLFSVFLGAGLASRVGASTAAFLAGWGAVMVSAAIAGAAFWPVLNVTAYDGELAEAEGGVVALVVRGVNEGALFGLYTGWLVGLSLLLTARAPRPEPQWLAGQQAPPATSTSYPTVYPPLPGSGEWSGLTAPLRKIGGSAQTPQPQAKPQPQQAAPPPQPDPRPLWPRSLPSNAPDGGAYGNQRQHRRPSWTRWSSNDDDNHSST